MSGKTILHSPLAACSGAAPRPLANPPSHRAISDKLDDAMGWKDGYQETSIPRAVIVSTPDNYRPRYVKGVP